MKLVNAFSGISVDNLEVAKDFYTRVLGLDIASEDMGLHFRLPFGGMLFMYSKPNHKPASFTALNLVVENIDEAVAELSSKGITFERYPEIAPGAVQDEKGILHSKDPSDGPSIAWFKDPAGNTISVLQDNQPRIA